jgi:flagellar FliJ protein
MSDRFKFRLQSVLDLKEQGEKDSAVGLAKARRDAESAVRAREMLETARESGRTDLARAHGAGGSVGHMRNLSYVLERVDDQIRAADEACKEAAEAVVERLEHYRAALRDRKTIEGLRERKFHQWRSEEVRSEQKAMDDIAITRHGRSGSAATLGAGK